MKISHKFWRALAAGFTLLSGGSLLADTINVSGNLTGTNLWKSTNEYVLNGFVYVLSGATLEIEPGTVVRGVAGSNNSNFGNLFICRGGKIFAQGTPQKPIIFTSEDDDLADPTDLGVNDVQLWGGIIVLGNARINNAVSAAGDAASPKYDIYEGLPDTQVSGQGVHRFGGSNDDDSSGVLRYVSIRHGGKVLESNKEVNGLSLCGVGRGTTVEYIEVFANSDDGFEFFGGSVNTRYLVSAFNEDEQFDADQGYNGKNQFWFGIQKTNSVEKGMELNGEPQDRITGTGTPVSNFEVYNATLVGAGARSGSGSGNNAFTFRAHSKPRIYNSIFTEFNGLPVTGPALTTGANPVVQNNLWWNFTVANFNPTNVFDLANVNLNTTNANPLLRGISRTNDQVLDPRPLPGSPALSSFKTTPTDGFYLPADYRGAFSTGDLWLRKWTFLDQGGFLPATTNVVNVAAGNITVNTTWSATNVYVLQGFVYVLDGVTLTIEPGTVVKGVAGSNNSNFGNLFICRGGKLVADGTPHNPIIFTAESDDVSDPTDLDQNDVQLWGGIIVLGNARINNAVSAAGDAANPKYDIYEGLPDTQSAGQFVHRFGGSNDDDNSGVIRYVSIRHGGKVLESNKEVNGLSLCGVGRNTVVECVEVFANSDDGFEFFGGSVNTKYLISAFNEDEQFDADQGYNGKNQFWFGIQKTGSVEKGMELNGEPQDRITGTGTPVSNFEVYNATLIGAGSRTGSGSGNSAFTIRANSKPFIYNSIITEFNGQPITGGAFTTGANPVIQDNLWYNFTVASFTPTSLFLAANNNVTNSNPLLGGISRTNDFGLDPRPATGSPAYANYRPTPMNGVYIDAPYQGAFSSANWAADWTILANSCILTSEGGSIKVAVPTVDIEVTTPDAGNTATVAWTGVAGRTYRVQSSTDLVTWTDETSWLAGTNGTMSQNSAVPSVRKMFRVLVR